MRLHREYHRYLQSLASSNSAENNFCLNILRDRSSEGVPRRSSQYSRELEGFSGNGWKLEEHCARGAHREWNLWQFTRLYAICFAKLFYAFSVTISVSRMVVHYWLVLVLVSNIHPLLSCFVWKYNCEIIKATTFCMEGTFSTDFYMLYKSVIQIYYVYIVFFLFLFLIHVNSVRII